MTTATMEQQVKTIRSSTPHPGSPLPSLEHYLRLSYPIQAVEDEGAWVVSHPDLPGCASFGPDVSSAIENLADARKLWIEGQIASGNPIPEPSGNESFSGKFVLRLPKSLHRLADMKARREGVSLNALITSILAGSLNYGGSTAAASAKHDEIYEDLWHKGFESGEGNQNWSSGEGRHSSHRIRIRNEHSFLGNFAERLGTQETFVIDASKEYHNAKEKCIGHK